MDIKQSISEKLKDAMRAKDSIRLQVLRSIKGEILKLETSGKNNAIDEQALLKIVKTLIKEKNESIQLAQRAKREDIIATEKDSLTILQTFLPEQFSEEELRKIINETIANINAQGVQDMGRVMQEVRKTIATSNKDADMGKVSNLVKQSLG